MDPAARVSQRVAPLLADRGFELFDVEFTGGVLRVSVDRPGGIDLEGVAEATRHVSDLLDEEDLVPGQRYTLEVSSPGVERPLRTPDHFRRYLGTTVAVKTKPAVEGERRIQGTLEAADDDGITVAGRTLAYGEIDRARTVFEWGPAPKPTTKKKAATS
ncbi:MAG TPA: ribosome maturation factor RimP [Acidimicrobiales bacterium]|nr:ribosome maturation factor RimP [Acidimicrobiales bacterium]